MSYFPAQSVTSINGQTGAVTGVAQFGPNFVDTDGRIVYWNTTEQRIENDRAPSVTSTGITANTATVTASSGVSISNASGTIRFGGTVGQTTIARASAQALNSDSALSLGSFTTALRPTGLADGYQIWDSTLGVPIWRKASAGTGWVNGAGAAV